MNVKNRGFGSMDKEKRHDIASAGGKKAHANGTAHKWTVASARAAAAKAVAARKAKAHAQTPEAPTE